MVQSCTKRDRRSSRNATSAAVFCASIVCMAGAASAQQPAPDTRAGRIAAQQQEKSKQLKHYEPNKAEVWVTKLQEQFITGSLHWHPFFESAYAGGGFTLGAGYATHVSSYNTIDVRGSYTFSGYKRIESEFRAPRLFDRRGTLSVLGGWREATQVGFYGIGTANTSARTTGPTTASSSPTRRRRSTSARRGKRCPRRRRRVLAVGSGPGRRHRALGRRGLHAGHAARPGRHGHLPALAGHGGPRLARPAAGYSRRGGYYGATVHDFADTDDVYSFRQVDYEAIQHLPIFRDSLGALAARPGRDHLLERRRPRSRSSCCRRSAADRACAALRAGGSATATACSFRPSGACSSTASSTLALFYDAGKVTARRERSRRRRLEERLRHRLPPARPGGHAAAHRVCQEQRRPRHRLLVEGGVLREIDDELADSAGAVYVSAPSPLSGVLAVLGRRHTAEPKFFSDDPLAREPETAGRLRRPAVGHRPVLRPGLQPVRHAAARSRPTYGRGNVNTIDEVPDSSWFTNRIGTRALTADEVVRGPIAGRRRRQRMDGHPREERGRRARLHRRRTRRADVLRLVRFAVPTPKAPPARWSSPRRSSGRSATTRSSTS